MPTVSTPSVVSIRRDSVSREIRLELSDWRTRTGGVYDLDDDAQSSLLLPGFLAHRQFLPDFVSVLATGDPTTVTVNNEPIETVVWNNLRVHVGGRAHPTTGESLHNSEAIDWYTTAALLHGDHVRAPGPAWLLDLIGENTPWGHLLQAA